MATEPCPLLPTLVSRVLAKVNSSWPNRRLVIALHSPNARLETGLRVCPPEKSQENDRLRCRAVLSPQSGLLRKNREKWASFAYFGGKGGGISLQLRLAGGESGIRTHVTLSSKHAFQACAFSHSAISPAKPGKDDSFRKAIASRRVGSESTPTRLHFILWAGTHQRKSAQATGNQSRGTRTEETAKQIALGEFFRRSWIRQRWTGSSGRPTGSGCTRRCARSCGS